MVNNLTAEEEAKLESELKVLSRELPLKTGAEYKLFLRKINKIKEILGE